MITTISFKNNTTRKIDFNCVRNIDLTSWSIFLLSFWRVRFIENYKNIMTSVVLIEIRTWHCDKFGFVSRAESYNWYTPVKHWLIALTRSSRGGTTTSVCPALAMSIAITMTVTRCRSRRSNWTVRTFRGYPVTSLGCCRHRSFVIGAIVWECEYEAKPTWSNIDIGMSI